MKLLRRIFENLYISSLHSLIRYPDSNNAFKLGNYKMLIGDTLWIPFLGIVMFSFIAYSSNLVYNESCYIQLLDSRYTMLDISFILNISLFFLLFVDVLFIYLQKKKEHLYVVFLHKVRVVEIIFLLLHLIILLLILLLIVNIYMLHSNFSIHSIDITSFMTVVKIYSLEEKVIYFNQIIDNLIKSNGTYFFIPEIPLDYLKELHTLPQIKEYAESWYALAASNACAFEQNKLDDVHNMHSRFISNFVYYSHEGIWKYLKIKYLNDLWQSKDKESPNNVSESDKLFTIVILYELFREWF